jgi:hypothetical protein
MTDCCAECLHLAEGEWVFVGPEYSEESGRNQEKGPARECIHPENQPPMGRVLIFLVAAEYSRCWKFHPREEKFK